MVRTRLGLFREALSDFNQAVRQAPELPLLYLHRGNAYGTLDDHRAALDDFTEAIGLKPDFAIAYYSRAVAWLHLGEQSRASEDCEAAIRNDENCAPAHFLRARLLDQLGVPGAAIASYDDAIRLAPDFAAAYAGRANAWVNAGDYDRAISDYRQAIHREPAAGQMLGQLRRSMPSRPWSAAWPKWNRGAAISFWPGSSPIAAPWTRPSINARRPWSTCPPKKSSASPCRSSANASTRPAPNRSSGSRHGSNGRRARRKGRPASTSSWPTSANWNVAMTRLCEIYRRLIERPDAAAGQRALACNNLAYFLAVREEDVRRALELADRAIEFTGPCPECLDTRGVALLAVGRVDEAVAELRRVVGNDPSGLRLYHLARACHAAGDEESALEAWDEARHQRELTLEQVPFYEQRQYRAFAELLDKEP